MVSCKSKINILVILELRFHLTRIIIWITTQLLHSMAACGLGMLKILNILEHNRYAEYTEYLWHSGYAE